MSSFGGAGWRWLMGRKARWCRKSHKTKEGPQVDPLRLFISFSSNFVDFYCFQFWQTIEVKKILSLLAFCLVLGLLFCEEKGPSTTFFYCGGNYLHFSGGYVSVCWNNSAARPNNNRFLSRFVRRAIVKDA